MPTLLVKKKQKEIIQTEVRESVSRSRQRLMWPQAKECHQPPETRRVKKQIVPRASRGCAVLPAP